MYPQRIFGLAIVALITFGGRAAAYTNQWAVHVEGGPEVAQQVAQEHGFQYLDKVSSKAKPSIQKLRKRHVNRVDFDSEVKDTKSNSREETLSQLSQLQEPKFPGVIESILKRKLPSIRILHDSLKCVLASYTAAYEPSHFALGCQNFGRIKKQITSLETQFSGHILSRKLNKLPIHLQRLKEGRVISCSRRKRSTFKLVKRDSKGNKQFAECDRQGPSRKTTGSCNCSCQGSPKDAARYDCQKSPRKSREVRDGLQEVAEGECPVCKSVDCTCHVASAQQSSVRKAVDRTRQEASEQKCPACKRVDCVCQKASEQKCPACKRVDCVCQEASKQQCYACKKVDCACPGSAERSARHSHQSPAKSGEVRREISDQECPACRRVDCVCQKASKQECYVCKKVDCSCSKTAGQSTSDRKCPACRRVDCSCQENQQSGVRGTASEYFRAMQKASPTYRGKPERYSGQASESASIGGCKKSPDCNPCRSTEEPEQRQPRPTQHKKREEKLSGDCATLNVEKPPTPPSKMDRIMSYVKKHGGNAFRACQLQKPEMPSKDKCRQGACPSLMRKGTSSRVPQETEVLPDPPPPKSVHWSQKSKTKRRYKRQSCSSSDSSPMMFVPYQVSNKRKLKSEKDQAATSQKPKSSRFDSGCCTKYSVKSQSTGDTRKFSSNVCMPIKRNTSAPSLRTTFDVFSKEISKRTFEIPAVLEHLKVPRGAHEKLGKTFEVEAAGTRQPNASDLKHRCSKCPQVEMWKIGDSGSPEVETRSMKMPSQANYLPPRRKRRGYQGSGKWKEQKYQIRLRIFKSPNSLDPCLPKIEEVKHDRYLLEKMKKPRLSPVQREISKFLESSCSPRSGGNVHARQAKKRMKGRATKRKKIVDDWYHMVHTSVVKRSAEPHLGVHEKLMQDRRVRRAEQQRVKSRTKRDLIIKRGPSNLKTILNDEMWPQMWYLNRGRGLDMNVQEAWAEGITGRGVVVTILDDGLEKNHPDLYKNYDPQASYDVNNHDEDPMPRYDVLDSNRHGTRCAGEVAATANNSMCAVGVAFGAGVGGVRMLDGDVTDAVEARSLSLNPQHIDIYSASWGPDDDGKTVDGPGELATRAFIEGITKGRNGKGSIFVWASGNGGRDHDNCNCDGYTNSIWTLSISSATENGQVPWYSEACSSTLATTYSSGSSGEKQVVTTDLHHLCTSSHTGTSASAPLAAGICALALEANKELTWRDMQHIVVRTAKPANLKAMDWVTNGVGRNVSHSFGYGLMDAAAMVRLARRWRTVPEQHKCEVSAPHVDRTIPPKSQLNLDLHVKECTGVNFLEHVQAKVSLLATRRGDLQIQLTSPQGTRSILLAKRPHDVSKAGFNQWPFMSVHTWGERPHGTWKLEIHNEGRYQGRATLLEWALIFHGTSTLPDRTEYALYNPAGMNIPRRPFVKPRETAYSKAQNSFSSKSKQAQHKTEKSGSLSPPYVVNAQIQSQRKGKVRGQHKNGKSANKPTPKPTVQTLRGLTVVRGPNAAGEVRLITSRPRGRSTPSPVTTTTVRTTPSTTIATTKVTSRQRIVDIATASSLQRGLILLEPAAKPAMNNVPAIFQQYHKIQQLYPSYPVYAGVRGTGQHATRAKGLELLQDEEFDSKNLDKDTLKEFKLIFYGTATSLEFDDDLDKDKPLPPVNQQDVGQDNTAIGARHNAVDTEGDPWTGSQQVERVSHPEVQRPTTENQTSGCSSMEPGSGRCLECKLNWYSYNGMCVYECPSGTYGVSDETKAVCTICHYSCLTCSGPSEIECTSCHEDAELSLNLREPICILRELTWTMDSTVWFYRMTVLFSINVTVFALAAIYMAVKWYLRKRDSLMYRYSKVSYSSNGDAHKDIDRLQENACLSDSE